MPVQTIGNISLPEAAPSQHAEHAHHRPLKGGIGDRSPGALIAEWPIPAHEEDETPVRSLAVALDEQFQQRPWLLLAGAAVLGIVVGKLFIRR